MRTELELLAEAALAALESDDPRTAVGCIIHQPGGGVMLKAANRLPPGISANPGRKSAPDKYVWIEHAERAALYEAARRGVSTAGASIYVHGGFPCADCARAIIASGIVAVVFCLGASDVRHWAGSHATGEAMFAEAGITITRHSSFGH